MRYTDTIDETHEFTAQKSGERLDKFLALNAVDQSRSFIRKLIDDDLVKVNDKNAKASCKLKEGDKVTLNIPELIEMSADPEDIPLDIIFEDKDIIVINKQPDFVVHPSPGHETGTLVNALLFHCKNLSGIGGELRPGIVHRLDRDTSGCMVCAKSDTAHKRLVEQFADRTTQKNYIAITNGVPREFEGKVDGYICRNPSDRKKMGLYTAGGKYSLTYYKVEESFEKFALVQCDIKTGRTHQIRVHLKSLGTPVLCDADYGRESSITENELLGKKKGGEVVLARQALHSYSLAFTHPITEEKLSFSAPLHADMQAAIKILRSKINV